MPLLTDQAWQVVLDLSRRYGVSAEAVTSMLHAVANGGGTIPKAMSGAVRFTISKVVRFATHLVWDPETQL